MWCLDVLMSWCDVFICSHFRCIACEPHLTSCGRWCVLWASFHVKSWFSDRIFLAVFGVWLLSYISYLVGDVSGGLHFLWHLDFLTWFLCAVLGYMACELHRCVACELHPTSCGRCVLWARHILCLMIDLLICISHFRLLYPSSSSSSTYDISHSYGHIFDLLYLFVI